MLDAIKITTNISTDISDFALSELSWVSADK